ncbi:MAG: hypothetical protein J5477_00545, partial [Schwartzia sp.]|nr:hypothetical protein [Schwartzia sp. (in: firmicutes)]
AVSLDPNDAYVYLNRAETKRAQGLPEAALVDIAKSIELDPKAIAARKMAADVEDELGHKENALTHYAAYYKLVPDATDIPDEYYKEIDPKAWKRIEKEREKEKQRAAEDRKKQEAQKDKKDDKSADGEKKK